MALNWLNSYSNINGLMVCSDSWIQSESFKSYNQSEQPNRVCQARGNVLDNCSTFPSVLASVMPKGKLDLTSVF